jgi:alpha-tubulin suppressor-like RCC1 family protein
MLGISNVIAVTTGNSFNLALRSDGLVFGCGYNSLHGVMGDNTQVNRSSFAQVPWISDVLAVSAGTNSNYALILRSDGLVFGAGSNTNGTLGHNTSLKKSSYTQAIGMSKIAAMGTGLTHALLLRSDGLVFGCGNNDYGALGDTNSNLRSTYFQVILP